MAFNGVLLPESASFAGQAAISRSLACQNTPEPVAGPISLSGTAGPAACGEIGMARSLSGRHSARANRPDRATKSQRNLIYYGGHNGGQDTIGKTITLVYTILYVTNRYSPQGSMWRERPAGEGKLVDRRVDHLPLPGAAPGGVKTGVAPSTISPSRAARRRAGREGTAPGAAPLAFAIENAGNPCPMRVSRQCPDHSGAGFTL